MADKERDAPAGKPPGEKNRSLDSILAFDRLEVGPVVVEKRRVIAPYTVVSGSKRDSTDLIYKYEEDVFDPQDPEDVNLASMMAAQIAMNYGLFTHEIVLKGSYDRHDQRFLLDVAENTAREIYVVKILMANPFITGPASSLTPERLKKYCRANIVFEGSAPASFQKKKANHSRYALLSSGGKDSLLSYGIIKEMGKDVHPIFINESGRHWYTAINSYRHFSEKVPNTTRVWTNSDRVFNWMLRQMPFVRQDFATMRADEYPIRLWTVAVFLFGAMPLAKKRGLGRIVIGDEYDTTVKMSYKGITHYNGLYDQSRYFDNALTRHYGRKGWNMVQFSLLRPMSEMLIEKMLSERYPDLLEQQVSCHATHLEDNRAVPCGQCEKCRRIVGMLLAAGKDPKKCGYTEKQVELCLSALKEKGVHQETVGAEHLAHMLSEKGMLGGGKMGKILARPRQEIMSLRFDKEKSPPNYLPLDIRMPVLDLMLGHAHGAVQRNGKMWVGMDVKNSMQFKLPYPHSSTSKNGDEPGKVQDGSAQEDGYILGEMT
ncbi:MAG: creatininase family protein, partial [Candidatus Thermoplasmatota archaeon]|nr:creatininase family protein [Candidatus Thermoplasmatota archaeon]